MMTESQKWLQQAEQLDNEQTVMQAKLAALTQAIDQVAMEEEYARNKYRLAYKEEIQSRRSYVALQLPRLEKPHAAPAAQVDVWKKLMEAGVKHPKYRYETQLTEFRTWKLLMNIVNFAQEMMIITNTQAWNPRNPNPYLP